MESFSLLKFLKDNSYLNQSRYDNLRYELDKRLYYYGNHFKYPHEINDTQYKTQLFSYLIYLVTLYKISQTQKSEIKGEVIVSNSYFTVNDELKKLGYKVFDPSWQISRDGNVLSNFEIFFKGEKIKSSLKNSNFRELIKEDFINEITQYEDVLKKLFQHKKVKSIFVPNDLGFFENLSIQICKQISIPSFIFLHGLPAIYNQIDNHRSDYLIVWGEKIKENYVKSGMNANKIFVSGHPYYKQQKLTQLKFSLDNILVLTKSLNGVHYSDGAILGDRSNLILFLYSVEKSLRKFGVKSVRFRPHPCENGNWYLKYINNDFYKLDEDNLQQSIQKSSLVIGPTSTVFLESLYYGVDYVIYEPSLNNIDIANYPLVPPFDGSDSKIPVSKNEDELEYILKNKIRVDATCFNDYITCPFDLNFIKKLI